VKKSKEVSDDSAQKAEVRRQTCKHLIFCRSFLLIGKAMSGIVSLSLGGKKTKKKSPIIDGAGGEFGDEEGEGTGMKGTGELTKFGRVKESRKAITSFGAANVAGEGNRTSLREEEELVIPLTKHPWEKAEEERSAEDGGKGKALPLLQRAIHPSLRDGGKQMDSKEQLEFEMGLKAADNTEETYKKVSVGDFGAALLRGMGWKGDKNVDGENGVIGVDPNFGKLPSVRGERVGLGAISSGESRGGYKGKRKPGDVENARERNEREGRDFWQKKVEEERKRRREEGRGGEDSESESDDDDDSSDSSRKKYKHKKKKKDKKKKKHKRSKH